MSINEGKLNPGIDYQFEIITYAAACLSENKSVENFWIYTSREIPIFDDIIVKVKYVSEEKPFVYLGQVKRYKKKHKINFNSGKDKVQKYLSKIREIKESDEEQSSFLESLIKNVPAENIEFWYISNSFWSNTNNYASTGPRQKPIKLDDGTDCYLEPNTTYKSIFPIRNGVSCYKLITDHCQGLPLNLRKLYFFLKQPDHNHVAASIENLNKDLISIGTANNMINFVNAYLKPKTEKRELTKYIFETHLLRLCLSPFIVSPTEAFEIDPKLAEYWNKLVTKFDVTLASSEMESYIFGCLWQEVIKLYDSHFNWNEIITKSKEITKQIPIAVKFKQLVQDKGIRHWLYIPDTIMDLLIEMWKCDYLPLVLSAYTDVSILDKYKHLGKRFVILHRKEKLYHELTRLDLRVFAAAADIHKVELAKEFLESILISMQGREPIGLFSILNDDRDLMEELKCDQLLYFIRERKKLLSSAQNFENARIKDEDENDFFVKNDRVVPIIGRCFSDNEMYISRHLCKPTVKETIRDSERKVICLLTGNLNSINWSRSNYYNLLNKSIDTIVSRVKPQTKLNEAAFVGIKDEHVEGLWSEFSSSEHALLHIEVERGMRILLKHRNFTNINSYISYDGPKFQEDFFFEKTSTGITVITGEPGSGKSTLLRSLFNTCDKHSFALFCDLKNYRDDLYERNKDLFKDPINFILRKEEAQLTLSNKQYSKHHLIFLRKLLEKTKELILFLDSFDEVLPKSQKQVLEFINKLNKSKGRLVIASRLIMADILANSLEVKLLKIDALSKTEIEKYINDQTLEAQLKKYPLGFLGNPMYLNFLITLQGSLPSHFTSSALYNAIIEDHIKRFYRQNEFHPKEYEDRREELLWIFKKLAVMEVFSVTAELKSEYEKLRDKCNFTDKSKSGLILRFNDEGPIFFHRTIAEFLVAERIIEKIHKPKGKKLYMMLEDHKQITYFMNDILCRDLVLHQAVIQKDLDEVKRLCSEDDKHLREVDKLNRSALYVAAVCCSDYTMEDVNCLILEEIVQQIILKGINSFERNSLTNSHWTDYLSRRHERFLYEVSRLKLARTAEMYFYCKNEITAGITWGIKKDMLDIAMALLKKDISLLNSCFSDFLSKVIPAMRMDLLFELIEFKSSTNPKFAKLCRACRNLLPITKVSKLANLKVEYWEFTAIHIACMSGNADVVRELIRLKVDVNAVDAFGHQPLYYAIGAGSIEIVTSLMKSFKKKANIKDKWGRPVFPNYLHNCIRKKYLEIAKILLLDEGFNKDERDEDHRTALHIAVKKCIDGETAIPKPDDDDSNINQIEFLLEHNLNVNVRDNRGETPLRIAIESERRDVIQMLLRYGANPDSRGDFDDITPLHIAIESERRDVIQMLLRHGANPNIEGGRYDLTSIWTAIRNRNREAVTLLLKYGADVNQVDGRGRTALFGLFTDDYVNIDGLLFIDDYDDIDNSSSIQYIIKTLVKAGANINHQDNDGNTALMIAIDGNYFKISRILSENGAEVNLQDIDGNTALHKALIERFNEHYPVAKGLVEQGANVNHQDKYGNTALIIAVHQDFYVIATMLLENGAEVNLQNKHGNTALHKALMEDSIEHPIAEALVKKGANVNHQVNDGDTALIIAVHQDFYVIATMLLENGAEVNLQNKHGNTALHKAVRACFFEFYEKYNIFYYPEFYDIFEVIKNRDIQLRLLSHMEIIEMLLKGDADNRDKIEDARARRAADLLKTLIDKGANVNAVNGRGQTALDIAIKYKTLVSHGEEAAGSSDGDDNWMKWAN